MKRVSKLIRQGGPIDPDPFGARTMPANNGKVPKSVRPRPKGGSRKGKPNKVTAEIKEMVVEALSELGGVAYLVDRGNDPRTATAFLGLVGKVLPLQVTGADGAPVQFGSIVRVIVEPGK